MRRRRRAREEQEKRKRENRRTILKKLCAALLRSFRGQHSEKMKGSARGKRDPREGQQPFRPNSNGVGERTTTLRRLLIGAGDDLISIIRLMQLVLLHSTVPPVYFEFLKVDKTGLKHSTNKHLWWYPLLESLYSKSQLQQEL